MAIEALTPPPLHIAQCRPTQQLQPAMIMMQPSACIFPPSKIFFPYWLTPVLSGQHACHQPNTLISSLSKPLTIPLLQSPLKKHFLIPIAHLGLGPLWPDHRYNVSWGSRVWSRNRPQRVGNFFDLAESKVEKKA